MEQKTQKIKGEMREVLDKVALIEDEVVEQREKLLLINWRMSRGVLLGHQIRGNIDDLS